MKKQIYAWLWRHHYHRILKQKGIHPSHPLHADREFLDIFIELYLDERRAILSLREMYNIYRITRQCLSREGELAEVGVFQGGSARIICEAKGDRPLHLFDTFEGMPAVNRDIDRVREGVCAGTSLEDVRIYLGRFPNLRFYKGRFPDSAGELAEIATRFCFVNLDVDIYESTLEGLRFFYPRMSKGGIILSHDYSSRGLVGVKKAVDEFMRDKPEPIVELWDSQALIVKA